jgi:hypothetical protein
MKGTKTMNVFSRFAGNGVQTSPLIDSEPTPTPLACARAEYKHACEELFNFCYRIQVTGNLPDPRALTRALIHYREARAAIAMMERRNSFGITYQIDAHASSKL